MAHLKVIPAREHRRRLVKEYACARTKLALAARFPAAFTMSELRDARDDVRYCRLILRDIVWLHYFTYVVPPIIEAH